jgi:hypothetical protein
MRLRELVLIVLMFLLAGTVALSGPRSAGRETVKLSETGTFTSSSDLFFVSGDIVASYEMVKGQQKEYAFRRLGKRWEKISTKGLRMPVPVALGACDPLNQVDIGVQHPEFAQLPSVFDHNLKQVIQTESYALLFVLARGSSVGGGDLRMILAVPKGSEWVEASGLPVSSSAEFCVAQSIETNRGYQSVFVFYNQPAGSGESFGVAAFDLKTSHSLLDKR